MSSLEDSEDDIQLLIQAKNAYQGAKIDDLGTKEIADSGSLRQLIKSNVTQSESFIGCIKNAKGNTQLAVTDLEQKYADLAQQLKQKVDMQH